MNLKMDSTFKHVHFTNRVKQGFTLIEVALAIGVLSLAVMAMLGMFAPTMTSVRDVLDSNQAIAVSDDVESYIESQPFSDVIDLVRPKESPGILYVIPYTQSVFNTTISGSKIESNIVTRFQDVRRMGDSLETIEGSFFRVEIKQLEDDTGRPLDIYDNARNEAYLPMLIELYPIAFNNPERNNSRENVEAPVFSFTSVKLR